MFCRQTMIVSKGDRTNQQCVRLMPEALRQAGNHCQELTFKTTLTPSYSQLHTRKTLTANLRTYMKEELLARSKYLTQSCVLKFVGHD